MAQFCFSISDYHSIKDANLKLDGITVIAGCNGSGKSTIARWVYSFVNYSNEFYHLIDEQFLDVLERRLYMMDRVLINTRMLSSSNLRQFRSLPPKNNQETDYSEIIELYVNRIKKFCEIIEHAVIEKNDPSFNQWVGRALGSEDTEILDYLPEFYHKSTTELDAAIKYANEKKQNYKISDLLHFIQSDFDLISDFPKCIEFKENGHDLIEEDRFFIPINLRNAIYIDTPMALSTKLNSDNKIWDDMMNALITPMGEMPQNAKKIAARIRRIIGGNIKLEKEEINDSYDIRYIRKSDNLNISINDAATGLKTFAYMLRLIENGYLNEQSILLIDEPEAHLHPQWIVEFARILVLLHKEVGTTILLASHNPDLVAAIKSISEAEDVSNKTSFYQASLDKESQRYSYNYLGNSIEGIFESFNIALNRIKDYGC